MDPEAEIDLLKSLIGSPQWNLFVSQCHHQYSDTTILERVTAQIERTAAGDELSQHESVRSVLAAQKAVLSMLLWPEERLKHLQAKRTPTREMTPVENFMAHVGRAVGLEK